MNSIILSLMLVSIGIFIMYIKDFFSILPIISIMLMLILDATVIYIFYKMNINSIDIALGIFASTILKVISFLIIAKHE
tara:strand:- start:42307 stop:42543 length:237 start_codon:yes stop_codon:yes gene_type:complete